MRPETLPDSITAPVRAIEDALRGYVNGAPFPPNLAEAVSYALLGPGKRLRPLLAWHACAAVMGEEGGGAGKPALPAGAAVELIHAFSLVHDDLPGMDDDDLRRGRPTLHRHTTEAMAILAGDAMLTLAFRVVAEGGVGEGGMGGSPALGAALTRELAEGTAAMIAGQVYDTLGGFPPSPPSPHSSTSGQDDAARLELVHRNKTGALIRAACRMGALCGLAHGGRPLEASRELEALTAYAEAVGLMFQIVDDLLDVTQTTHHLGKTAGKDEQAGKLTYPRVHGLERSRSEIERLHGAALAAVAGLGPAAEPLRQLCSYMAVRSR